MSEITLKEKEQIDIDHILAAAPDGCMCDLCEAARKVGSAGVAASKVRPLADVADPYL